MTDHDPELTEIAEGLLRLAWPAELQQQGIGPSAEAIRAALAQAFQEGARRVEVHVDPSDVDAQRIATFSGLMKEGVARGVHTEGDRVVYARLADDEPLEEPMGFRRLLNSFLPRKRAIAQMIVRDPEGRVLLCQLTYKKDWDLPGGVVEVGESPHLAVSREVLEELALELPAGALVLTDWLPPWGGWDDAVCLVFDGGVHAAAILDDMVKDRREIRGAEFCTMAQVEERCADFTARRISSALMRLEGRGSTYTESGRQPTSST